MLNLNDLLHDKLLKASKIWKNTDKFEMIAPSDFSFLLVFPLSFLCVVQLFRPFVELLHGLGRRVGFVLDDVILGRNKAIFISFSFVILGTLTLAILLLLLFSKTSFEILNSYFSVINLRCH